MCMLLARFIIEICVAVSLIGCIPQVMGTLIDVTRKVAEILVKGLRIVFKLDPPEEKKKEEKKD